MPRIIQGRIGVALWGSLVFALLAIAAYSWIQLGRLGIDTSEQQYLDDARTLAYFIESINGNAAPDAEIASATDALQRYTNATGNYTSLHDARGSLLFASGETGSPEQAAGAQEIRDALGPDGSGMAQRLNPAYGEESAWFAHALPDGSGVVRISVPLSEFSDTAAPYRQLLLYTSAAAAVIILLLLIVTTQRVTAPLRRLAVMLQGGESPSAEDFSTANAEVRDIVLLIGRRSQEERGITTVVEAQQTRLNSLLDNLAVGIIVLADDERVVLANTTAAQLFGFRLPLPRTATLVGLVRDYEAAETARRALRESTVVTGEITFGGEPTSITRIVASPFREAGEQRVLLAAYDVSEERRAQRLRHEFLANASHEIRTPLAGIQATLETLDLGAIDDPGAARPFVSSALDETQRLTAFVENLLDLSRLEMGWARLVTQPVSVSDAVDECVGTMASMASRAGIDLVTDVEPDVPQISADPGRLHQALVNLVHNAIKFTPSGGQVTVSATKGDRNAVRLRVRDTGVGISPEDSAVLMDRVGQGDESGMRGGGLGLAIVKQIVEAHGGDVLVESAPGEGSVFSLLLPVADENP